MKELQQYCPICKKETRHVIAFYGSPVGWNCAEHDDLDHCCKCGREIPQEIKELAKKIGANNVVCENCSFIGGTGA